MTHIELGERIREIRKVNGLTREQLATRAELSVKFIYEVENGKKGLSVDSLMKIANALSCSCDYMLLGETIKEERYDKIVDMLADFDDKDVEYVAKMLAMMKDTRDK